MFATLLKSPHELKSGSARRKGGEEVNALYSDSREIHMLKSCKNVISKNESELSFYGVF